MWKLTLAYVGCMILLAVIISYQISACNKQVEEAGGYSQVMVDLGKEAKDIKKRIEE